MMRYFLPKLNNVRAPLIQYEARAGRSLATSATDGQQKFVMVQGASRGLGLEFVRQLSARDNFHVYATCRDPSSAQDLDLLSKERPNVSVLPVDVTRDETIAAAKERIGDETGGRLDMLLNVAGVLHIPGKMQPEVSFDRITSENINRAFQVNAIGPMLTARHMIPLLAKGGDKKAGKPAVLASLSARVGSISDNSLGGWYSYRASKVALLSQTALNQLMKTLSIELARKKMNISCILLHPGTCDTDMSEPFRRNVSPEKLFSKDRAVRQLLELVDGATLEDSGRYIAWDGQDIPW